MSQFNGYDLEYYERTLRLNSGTAEAICRIRWEFVMPAITRCRAPVVLDYGSGVGWFRAWRPEGVIVDSYDIGASPSTGINQKHYDLVCFWDVLEHLPSLEPAQRLMRRAEAVAVTVPVRPPNVPRETWKHTKPGEHRREFTDKELVALLLGEGLTLEACGWPECPPRQDILSALFLRKG